MTRLYVSGPMTGYPEHNFPRFNEVSALLVAAGYEVENPAEKGEVAGWTWEDYLRYDIRTLMDCQGVATLEGHEDSKGAQLELHIAHELKMPVKPFETWLLHASVQLAHA